MDPRNMRAIFEYYGNTCKECGEKFIWVKRDEEDEGEECNYCKYDRVIPAGSYGPGWKTEVEPSWDNLIRALEDGLHG